MKKNILTIVFFLSLIITGCNAQLPLTENDCKINANKITTYIKNGDYKTLNDEMHKYEDYQKYTEDDLKKWYRQMQTALDGFPIDGIKKMESRDTVVIDYVTSKDFLLTLTLNFFITNKDKAVVHLCEFKYTKESKEKYYQLSYFEHYLRPKIKPVMPPPGTSPNMDPK